MKKSIVLDLFNVTGERDLMKTEFDDDLTLRMLERRLVSAFVDEDICFGKLYFKQGKRYLHKKTKLHDLCDGQVLHVLIELKLMPILELESTKFGCSACMTPYEQEFCKTVNYICVQCYEFL